MPAMMYGLGVPAAVAVGTDVFQREYARRSSSGRRCLAGAVVYTTVAELRRERETAAASD